MPTKHLYIPDTQAKPGVDFSHLHWVGQLITDEKPDVIIHAGDHFDMPSLSSYDKGKLVAEGRRLHHDFEAGHEAMNILLYPMLAENLKRAKAKKKLYSPRMVFTLGNHEERLLRHIEAHAELAGFLSFPESFKLHKYGWEVIPYLQPVTIDGVAYAHYFYNPNTGKPYGGACLTKLKNIGTTFVQGHVQGLDLANRTTNTGVTQWGIQAGSCYLHDEGYKGPQANAHWRGVLIFDNVVDGNFDPRPISMASLKEKYGD